MRTQYALLAIAIAACLILGYRVIGLERELAEVSATLGTDEPATEPSDEEVADTGEPKPPPRIDARGLRQRMAALEGEVEDLRATIELLNLRARHGDPSGGVGKIVYSDKMEQRILDVLTAEDDRKIEQQIDWHKNSLVMAREAGVNQLALVANLSAAQKDAVLALLRQEADSMVEILKDPGYRNNVEEAVRDLRSIIRRTDDQVAPLLDNQQMEAYRSGRLFEQLMIMPWAIEQQG